MQVDFKVFWNFCQQEKFAIFANTVLYPRKRYKIWLKLLRNVNRKWYILLGTQTIYSVFFNHLITLQMMARLRAANASSTASFSL